MKTKQTPGPWQATVHGDLVFTDKKQVICEVRVMPEDENNPDPDYLLANSRLIAAAPELLEALNYFLRNTQVISRSMHPKIQGCRQKAYAAIKKAIGTETDPLR